MFDFSQIWQMPSQPARVLVSIIEVYHWLDKEKHVRCWNLMIVNWVDLPFLDGAYVGCVLLYNFVFLILQFLRSLGGMSVIVIYFA